MYFHSLPKNEDYYKEISEIAIAEIKKNLSQVQINLLNDLRDPKIYEIKKLASIVKESVKIKVQILDLEDENTFFQNDFNLILIKNKETMFYSIK